MQIKCDHCGAVAETIEPKTARAGELEYTFFGTLRKLGDMVISSVINRVSE